MRFLVVLLVAANAGFFAYATGLLDNFRGADATRVAKQVNADALKVLPSDSGGAATAVGNEAAPAKTPQPQTNEAVPVSAESLAAKTVCLSWRVSTSDADRLARFFSERFSDFGLERHKLAAGDRGWRVFVPVHGEKSQVDRKKKELDQRGIRDHFTIAEGEKRFLISLGVYATEKAAQGFLTNLKAKGIDEARLKPLGNQEGQIRLEARGSAAMKDEVLEASAKLLAGAKAQVCP